MLGKCRDPDGTTMVPPANLFQKGRAPYCALQLVWLNLLTPRSKGKHFYPRFFPPRLSLWGGRQTWKFDNYENKDGLTQDMAVNQGMLVMACDLPILLLQESSSLVSLTWEIPRVTLSTHIGKLSYGNWSFAHSTPSILTPSTPLIAIPNWRFYKVN